jgi:hypothetical protein
MRHIIPTTSLAAITRKTPLYQWSAKISYRCSLTTEIPN